jgi:hypothetical protein
MSNWHDVAVLVESLEQQVVAAISDYGPMPDDERAQALLDEATAAFRKLHEYAESKTSEALPPPPTIEAKLQHADNVPAIFAEFAAIAGVDEDIFRTSSHAPRAVAARAAIAWTLRHGVKYEAAAPSWPTFARVVGSVSHSTLIAASYRSQDCPHLVSKLFDYCDAHGIATNPRPDWARKEVA